MKQRRIVTALVALAAACGKGDGENSADAARADSSAAGYAVGQPTDSARANGDTTRPVIVAAAPNVGQPAAAGSGTGGGKAKPTMAAADTMRVGAMVKPPLPNGGTLPRVDSVVTPPAPSGPVRVNEFLTYDARSQTVSLQLIAGYNGLNGSLNYNGSTNGNHGITVPMGWRIHVSVANRDSDLQHSAIVVREVLPPAIEPVNPAFGGAALPQLAEGLHEDETGTLDFVADQAGRFMIACGVAGHAQAGMWLQLAVVKDASVPTYR